ncbi:hypothetical protein Holit_03229 [Hollandina sp. SP2]
MGFRGFVLYLFGGGIREALKVVNPGQRHKQGFLFPRRGIGEVGKVLRGPLRDERRPLKKLYRAEGRG